MAILAKNAKLAAEVTAAWSTEALNLMFNGNSGITVPGKRLKTLEHGLKTDSKQLKTLENVRKFRKRSKMSKNL